MNDAPVAGPTPNPSPQGGGELSPATRQAQANQMPRWLVYGLAAKLVLVVAIVVAVLGYAGILW